MEFSQPINVYVSRPLVSTTLLSTKPACGNRTKFSNLNTEICFVEEKVGLACPPGLSRIWNTAWSLCQWKVAITDNKLRISEKRTCTFQSCSFPVTFCIYWRFPPSLSLSFTLAAIQRDRKASTISGDTDKNVFAIQTYNYVASAETEGSHTHSLYTCTGNEGLFLSSPPLLCSYYSKLDKEE